MFAIVRIKGFQYFVKTGEKLIVPKLDLKENTETIFDEVLFLKTDSTTLVGNPKLMGASVQAKVITHLQSNKVTTFKFIRRENYRRLKGHKQHLTELEVIKINYHPEQTKSDV